MYKHQIMEVIARGTSKLDQYIYSGLQCAQEIFIGQSLVYKKERARISNLRESELCECEQLIRLPFPTCLISFFTSESPIDYSVRMACLIMEGASGILVNSFFYALGTWYRSPIFVECSEGGSRYLIDKEDMKNLQYTNFLEEREARNIRFVLQTAHSAISTINAKNIYLEPVEPPAALNKKRIKNGKHPLYRYHVLKFTPGKIATKGSNGIGIGQNLGSMPVHLCRGHFREYTEDKPLFGREGLFGRFWVQPHARGDKKNGVVMKDYELKQAAV